MFHIYLIVLKKVIIIIKEIISISYFHYHRFRSDKILLSELNFKLGMSKWMTPYIERQVPNEGYLTASSDGHKNRYRYNNVENTFLVMNVFVNYLGPIISNVLKNWGHLVSNFGSGTFSLLTTVIQIPNPLKYTSSCRYIGKYCQYFA